MIGRLAWAILMVLGLAAPALAQQRIPVLSGDHDGYTRLVFQVDPTYRIEMSESQGMVRMIFPDRALSFALERLFRPISRSRLRAIRQGILGNGSVIELDLACECRIRSFAHLGRYIVIDILDAPGTSRPVVVARPKETASPEPEAFVQESTGRAVPPVAHNADTNVYKTARNQLDLLPRPQVPVSSAPAPLVPVETARSSGASPDESPEHDVTLMRNVLLEQLTRAAEQGLIRFDGPPPTAIDEAEPAPAAATQAQAATPEIPPPVQGMPETVTASTNPYPGRASSASELLADDPQVSVVTVFDRDDPPKSGAALGGAACPPDADFAVWDWVGDAPAYGQIAAARAALLGEFDLVDQAAVLNLARLYVGLGFGREALAVLAAYGPTAGETLMLTDLALAVDRLPSVRGGALDATLGCNGHPALWRGVAFGMDAPPDKVGRAAMFAAFATLPVRHRRLLGPRLTEALLAAGDAAAASMISKLVARAPGDHGPEQRLATARLGLSIGANETDRAALRQLAERGRDTGPEALVLLVNNLVDRDEPVPDSLLADLELAHFQNREGPVAARLLATRARALSAAGSADRALDILAASQADSDSGIANLDAMTAAALRMYAPDPGRPDRYVIRVGQHLATLSIGAGADAARRVVARHHIALGLPEIARMILAPPLARGDRVARLIAAEALLEEGDPAPVLDILAGSGGADAAALRARASAMAGDPGGAARFLAGTDTALTVRQEYAWQAGDWQATASVGAAPRRQLAKYMRSRPSLSAQRRQDAGDVAGAGRPPPATLLSAREVLDRSAAARDLVLRATADATDAVTR